MRHPDLLQHAHAVGFARRLHQPGQDQLHERVIAQNVEPEPGVGAGQHIPQQRAPLARDDSASPTRPGRRVVQAKIEGLLPGPYPLTSDLHQHSELRLVVRGADVLQDHVAASATLSDLDLRGARAASGSADEHHERHHTQQRGTSIPPNPSQ